MRQATRKAPVHQNPLAEAVDLHRRGEFEQAEKLYRTIIKKQPGQADALNLLGLICYQRRNYQDALRLIKKAINCNRRHADYHNNLGTVLKDMQRWEEALEAYNSALALQPDDADIHFNLAGLYLIEKQADKAIEHYQKTLALKPAYASAYSNLASLYYEQGEFDRSIDCCRKGIAQGMKDPLLLSHLGAALTKKGRPDEAAAAFKAAIALEPGSAGLYLMLGAVLSVSDSVEQTIACYRKVIELDPQNHGAFMLIGSLLKKAGHLEEAVRSYQLAIGLRPDEADAYNEIGAILKELGYFEKAGNYYQKAHAIEPENIDTLIGIGTVEDELGKKAQAQEWFLKAVELRPDYALPYCFLVLSCQQECNWEGVKKYGPLLDALTEQALEQGLVPNEGTFWRFARHPDGHLNYEIAKAHSTPLYDFFSKDREILQVERATRAVNRKRLTIGYLSNNFLKSHPGTHLIAGLFELHDRTRFKVFCYSYEKGDPTKYGRLIQEGCDRFFDIRELDHLAAARKMVEDGVDILVDFTVGIKGHRPGIAALRPAPVQVRWLALLGTSGSPAYDYFITDEIMTPHAMASHYSENFCYMPHSYQPNTSIQTEEIVPITREQAGLPQAGFVFCSFCTTYKIDETVFNAWMSILGQVPGSLLWMLAPGERAVGVLKSHARQRGIKPERIVFAQRMERTAHLNRLGCADLWLDTLTVNGAATASEALWCGVPVVALQGQHCASRVSSGILHGLQMPELVTHSLEGYVAQAVRLATDAAAFGQLKRKLAEKKRIAPLFDKQRFVKNLETRYRQMWRRYASGQPPAVIGGRDEEQGRGAT